MSLTAHAEVFFAAQTLLVPAGMLQEWLPEHHKTAAIIANDGARLHRRAKKTPKCILARMCIVANSYFWRRRGESLFSLPGGLAGDEAFFGVCR